MLMRRIRRIGEVLSLFNAFIQCMEHLLTRLWRQNRWILCHSITSQFTVKMSLCVTYKSIYKNETKCCNISKRRDSFGECASTYRISIGAIMKMMATVTMLMMLLLSDVNDDDIDVAMRSMCVVNDDLSYVDRVRYCFALIHAVRWYRPTLAFVVHRRLYCWMICLSKSIWM